MGGGVADHTSTDSTSDRSPWAPGWPENHMLEAAMGLIANAVAFDPATNWDAAAKRWMAAYLEHICAGKPEPAPAEDPEPPMPPRDWLDKFSASSKGSGGHGWQTGWMAGHAAARAWGRRHADLVDRVRKLCHSRQIPGHGGHLTDVEVLWPSEVLAVLGDDPDGGQDTSPAPAATTGP